MITESAAFSAHLDDAELMRHIDSEGDPVERDRWHKHLGECIACAREVALLRGQSEQVTGWLERADLESPEATVESVTAPRARRGFRAAPLSLRLAASLVLVAGPLAAITPVREWVGDRVAAIRSAESPDAAATLSTEQDFTAADEPQQPILRFVPGTGRFTVVLAAAQSGGSLRVQRVTGPEAHLDSDQADVPTLVSANLLRIENVAGSSASYTLSLPASVDALDVVIGGSTTRLDRAALDASRAFPLQR